MKHKTIYIITAAIDMSVVSSLCLGANYDYEFLINVSLGWMCLISLMSSLGCCGVYKMKAEGFQPFISRKFVFARIILVSMTAIGFGYWLVGVIYLLTTSLFSYKKSIRLKELSKEAICD